MKKHIGFYKDSGAVREALRTKDLFSPYLVYATDYNQVMYNPWNYIDVNFDYQQGVDTIDVTAEDSNTHRLDIRCYKNFYWECVQVSDGITDFNYSEGDTGYASRFGSNFQVSNNLGAARTLYIKFNFREEENGPVVYEAVATINQAKNENAIIGWYVDGQVTTEQINIPYTGGTAQISIEGAESWVIYDPNHSEVASGNTDQIVTVNIGQNPNEWESVESYSVNWVNSKGDSYENSLTYRQEGIPQPGVVVENAPKDEMTFQYYVPNDQTALTFTFNNCENYAWNVLDNTNQNVIASGSGNTSVSIPVVSNSGNTPIGAFEYSGTPAYYINIQVYDPNTSEDKYLTSLQAYVMPNNPCLFFSYEPSTSSTNVQFTAGTVYLSMYAPDGGVYLGTDFDSQSSYFQNDWTASEEETEWGWRITVNTSNNMEEVEIPVEVTVTVGIDYKGSDDRQYVFNIEQGAYSDPSVTVTNLSYKYEESGLYVIRNSSTTLRVRLVNTIPGDVIEWSTDGENWTANTQYYQTIQRNQTNHPVTLVPELQVHVIRDGSEVWNWGMTLAQDTNYRPYIAWDSDPSDEINIEGYADTYTFYQQPGNYTLTSVDVAVEGMPTTAMTASLGTDGRIELSVEDNYSGEGIVAVLSAFFEDGNGNQVSYDIIVNQAPIPMTDIPLTFEITSPGNIVWADYDDNIIEYSINGGNRTTTNSVTNIPVSAGDVVEFWGDNASYSGNSTFNGTTCGFNVKGNVMSLIHGTGDAYKDPDMWYFEENDALYGLFTSCQGLVSAANLALPAETLYYGCYHGMFEGCTNLTNGPELPATTLAEACYQQMFEGCSSMEVAPELPAPVLEPYCYSEMFRSCSVLNTITCLATDISATDCTHTWVEYVPSSGGASSSSSSAPFEGGSFFKDANMSNWQWGDDGIPNGWDVYDA